MHRLGCLWPGLLQLLLPLPLLLLPRLLPDLLPPVHCCQRHLL